MCPGFFISAVISYLCVYSIDYIINKFVMLKKVISNFYLILKTRILNKILFLFVFGVFIRFLINNCFTTSFLGFLCGFLFILDFKIFHCIFQVIFEYSKIFLDNELSYYKTKTYNGFSFKKSSNLNGKVISDVSSEDSSSSLLKKKKYSNLMRENVINFNRWENVDKSVIDRFRRKIYWVFLEGRKDYYGSYKNFKPY